MSHVQLNVLLPQSRTNTTNTSTPIPTIIRSAKCLHPNKSAQRCTVKIVVEHKAHKTNSRTDRCGHNRELRAHLKKARFTLVNLDGKSCRKGEMGCANLLPDYQSEGDGESIREHHFESQEMQAFIRNQKREAYPKDKAAKTYCHCQDFPKWIIDDPIFLNIKDIEQRSIAEIFKLDASQRTQKQISQAVAWLQDVWHIAKKLGWKRTAAMTCVMQYEQVKTGENVVCEGEPGYHFYIILSGHGIVSKSSVGVVGNLKRGESFGEIALTSGNEVRRATVSAAIDMELLSLRKSDYEHFVKNIQEADKRNALKCLSYCPIFQGWTRSRLENLCNVCQRVVVEKGDCIFREGDIPTHIYFVMEGVVEMLKERLLINTNRWPVGNQLWKEVTTTKLNHIPLMEVTSSGCFGELAILSGARRVATARAKTRAVLLSLDKLEFVNILKKTAFREKISELAMKYSLDMVDATVIQTLNKCLQSDQQQAEYDAEVEKERRRLYGWVHNDYCEHRQTDGLLSTTPPLSASAKCPRLEVQEDVTTLRRDSAMIEENVYGAHEHQDSPMMNTPVSESRAVEPVEIESDDAVQPINN